MIKKILVPLFLLIGTLLVSQAGIYAAGPTDALGIDSSGNANFSEDLTVAGTITGIGMPPPGAVLPLYYTGDFSTIFDANGAGIAGTPYEGWQLCNGNNNSPNLLNKFIVSTGTSYKMGDTGGTDAQTLTVSQMPVHSHGGATGGTGLYLNYQGVQWDTKGVSTGIVVSVQQETPDNRPNLLTTRGHDPIQILPGNHTHSIANDGGGQSFDNRPQYFALAYIIRS